MEERQDVLTRDAARIVGDLGLPAEGWTRSITGFTNEIWFSERYVLKIYHSERRRREMEQAFYRLAPIRDIPKLIEAGEDWSLLERIWGTGLFSLWPDWSRSERRDRFVQAFTLAGRIMDLPRDALPEGPACDWHDRITGSISTSLASLESDGRFEAKDLPGRCRKAVEAFGGVLKDGNDLCWLHPDFHFDNLLWSERKKSLYLLDFEDLCYAPADYFLDTPLRMIAHPHLYANEIDDPRQKKVDYEGLEDLLKETLPRCFAHPRWRERTALYAMAYDLRHLAGAPKLKSLIQRVEDSLNILQA